MTRIRHITAAAGLLVRRLVAGQHRRLWLGVPAATVLAAGLLATAPAASAAPAPPAGVSLAQVGNDLLLAGQGGEHNLDVYYQPVGSSTWSHVVAAKAYTVYSRASITALTEGIGPRRVTLIAMAAEGANNTLNFWWQALAGIGSGPWHQEVLSGVGTTFSAPSIVQIGNEVAVAAEGANHSLNFWWQTIGATGWDNYLDQDQGNVYSAPAMAALTSPSDTVGIAFSGSNGDVYYDQQTPFLFGEGLYGPYQFGFPGLATLTPPAPSIAVLDNNMTAITTQGSGNSLDSWTTANPPYFPPTTLHAYPGAVYSNVSMTQLGGGVVAATAQSSQDTLGFFWQSNSGGPWHAETLCPTTTGSCSGQPSGTDLSAGPPVIALTNSTGLNMVATASEGPGYSADIYWQIVGSSAWHTIAFGAGAFGA